MNAARRAWLQRAALAACAMQLPRWAWANPQPWQQDPFTLGVASGEPGTHSLVLWTRLAGAPPQLPAQTVHWELAHDAQFRRPVQRGQALAAPEWGHSVHVQLQGLQPGRWYFYRFHCGGATSATGRTRTAPAAGELPAQLRLVFASCQRWEHGQYAAWWHAAQDAPDLVLFLGDYIYEYASPRERSTLARSHELPLARTLQDYRDRYALHKSDPLLQAAHAACPWAVTWDDHEVENDWAGSAGRAGPDGAQAFAPQRAAAFQAYYENMPLSATAWLQGGLQLYRSLDWGQLARIHLLDDRQYRDWQACRQPGSSGAASVRASDCPSLHDGARTLLGPAQEQWLAAQLAQAPARWSVLAQQTLFSPRHYPSGLQSTDNWDGYPAARARLLASLQQHPQRNTVFLGGDIHQNYVCQVHAKAEQPDSALLASEFCSTSISSRSGTTQEKVDAIARHNPHVLLARCEERGYGLAEITPQTWRTTLRAVANPLDARSPAYNLAQFVVTDGHPGPVRA